MRVNRTSCRGQLGALVLTAVLSLAALNGCGQSSSAKAGAAKPAPDLASVTTLADPRSYDGPSTALLADTAVRPIAKSPQPTLPVTLTDVQGTKVKVIDTSRVLALDLYGTLARTVYELGLGESLVGRSISSDFAEIKSLPLVTHNGHELNAESILDLDPTLVITDTSLGPWDVVLQLRDAGIPVVVTDPKRSLDNVDTITRQVAEALGVPAAGEQLVKRINGELAEVETKIAKVKAKAVTDQPRTVFIYARGGAGVYHLFGEGTGADSLIKSLGLYDVAKEIDWKGSKPLTDEGIVAAQPDLIVMMTKGLDSVGGIDGLFKRYPALAQTPAGQQRRVVDMADSEILGYGPLTPQVLNALAVAVYAPDAVKGT
ncbi:MAG: ABC transporter substrate-binding protein [Marmoricola sp.]